MVANFPLSVRATVDGCSPAQGQCSISTSPDVVTCPTDVQLTVNADNLSINKLPGGTVNVTVARMAVTLIPKIGRWESCVLRPSE